MIGDASLPVWIGTPQRGRAQEDVLDPYTSKIGGPAAYFRVGSTPAERLEPAALSKHFQCPQCKSTAQVSLLSQVYAPLEVYDRVLYILTCAACARRPAAGSTSTHAAAAPAAPPPPGAGKKSGLAAAAAAKSLTSFCFAVRSQNFSREYFAELQQQERKAVQLSEAAQAAKAEADTPLFDEGDEDWGDGAEDWGGGSDTAPAPATASSSSPAPTTVSAATTTTTTTPAMQAQVSFPLAARATLVPLKGTVYTTGLPLDLYVEPTRAKAKELSMEEQLAVAERMYGDHATIDTSGFEEDDETPAEACVREYMEEMETNASQCVRWCPGGTPLRTSLTPIGLSGAANPPPCPACGAPRQFEMQLTAPTVYFLTKDIGEVKNTTLHFSNVLLYTCSKHCYAATGNQPYMPEYVVVEDEL